MKGAEGWEVTAKRLNVNHLQGTDREIEARRSDISKIDQGRMGLDV